MGTMAGDGAGLDALLELLTRAAGLRSLDVATFAAQLLPAAKAYWADAKGRGVQLGAITAGRLVDQRHEHRSFNDVLAFLELEDAEVGAIFPVAQMTVEELRFHLNDERPFDWIKRSPPDRIVFEGRCWDFRHQDCECGHCWDSAGTKPTCLEEEV